MTMLDIDYLVKAFGYMKPQGISFKRLTRIDLLTGEPPIVGEGKFEFVAVISIRCGADYRSDFGKRDFGYPFELVNYLLSFGTELGFILDMLPLTTSTYTKMRTKGFNPVFGIFMKPYGFPFQKTALASCDPDVHYITRGYMGNKNHLPFIMRYAFSFSRKPFHQEVFQYLVF